MLLDTVKKDGIDLESLVYEEGNVETLVQRLLKEYDTEKGGFLTKSEFIKLGDLILSAYEERMRDTFEHKQIGDWIIGHTLGEGSYGVVKLAINTKNGEKRAVKIIKETNVSNLSKLDSEVQV